MANFFYRNGKGDFRAKTGRGQRLLGRFLEADIQGSVGLCDEILSALADIAAGRQRRWQMTGNAHTLVVSKRLARIRAELSSAPDLVISPAELRRALQEWKTLLDT